MTPQPLSPQLAGRVERLSDETLVLVLEAFREGSYAGEARLRSELSGYLSRLFEEFETTYEGAKAQGVANVDAMYVDAQPSPTFAAHFGGAGDLLERVRAHLRSLTPQRVG